MAEREALLQLAGSSRDVLELLIDAAAEGSVDGPASQQEAPGGRRVRQLVLLLAAAASSGDGGPLQLRAALSELHLTLEEAVRELGPAVAALEQPVAAVLGSEPPLAQRVGLKEVQQAFVLYRVLAKKARDLHAAYFAALPAAEGGPTGAPAVPPRPAAETAGNAREAAPEQPELASPLCFFWLLFCTARRALLPPQADLVTSFALLLACTHFLLLHAPAQQRREDSPAGAAAAQALREGGEAGQEAEALLAAVAGSHSAAEHLPALRQLSSLVAEMAREVLLPAVQAAPAAGPAQQQQQQQQQAAAAALVPVLFDAAGQPHPAAVAALQQRYAELGGDAGIDALDCLFLPPPTPAGPATLSPAPVSGLGAAEGAGAAPAAMDVDGASLPAAAGAAGESGLPGSASGVMAAEAGSPESRAPASADAVGPQCSTPPRQPGLAGPPDTAFRTPSPVKRRLPSGPLPPATPITSAMSSTAWLRSAVASQPEGPSEALQETLKAARLDSAAAARLVEGAQQMAAAVFRDSSGQLEGPLKALEASTNASRRSEGVRLYWRSLEGLVAAERARPGASPGVASGLLSAPLFHRCVAACSFEVVASAYRMGALEFPAVLERLSLPAFELCKVLGPFVQQLPGLPRDLKRHLLSVEERCLESLAWQAGSSLYPTLAAAVGAPSPARNGPAPPSPGGQRGGFGSGRVGSMTPRKRTRGELAAVKEEGEEEGEEEKGAGGDAEMRDAEPAAEQQPAEEQRGGQAGQQGAVQPPQASTQSSLPLSLGMETAGPGAAASGSPDQGQTGAQPGSGRLAAPGDRSARAAMAEFLRRLLRLLAIRMADLLARLPFHPADPALLLTEAFTLAQHLAFEHTWLLYGRHADQLMLCCLYAVCKARQLDQVSLRAILTAYGHQPQARPETFKSVVMTPREQTSQGLQPTGRGDIIEFYNQVFIPDARPFLHRMSEDRSLLAQPPSCALPYLQQAPQLAPAAVQAKEAADVGVPAPPVLLQPANGATSCAPQGLLSPRGLLGTPTRTGGMQLLSPGSWRINRGSMTPLASPGADRMAALTMNSPSVKTTPWGPAAAHAAPSPPLSAAAIHRMFGSSSSGSPSLGTSSGDGTATAASQPVPAPLPAARAAASPAKVSLKAAAQPAQAAGAAAAVQLPAAAPGAAFLPLFFPIPALAGGALAPGAMPLPLPLPAGLALSAAALPPMPPPATSTADVLELFAGAEAAAAEAAAEAAAAAATAVALASAGSGGTEPMQQQEADEAAEELEQRLTALPAENLPLLAAAAMVAEEIERKEKEVAAAFSALRPGSAGGQALSAGGGMSAGGGSGDASGAPSAQQQQPEEEEAPASPPGAQHQQQSAAADLLPAAEQQQAPLVSARHARRILALQPAAAPVQ